MAFPVRLDALMAAARQRADMQFSQFVTDPELVTYINESIGGFYDLLTADETDEYYRSEGFITTASNQDVYPLPADFYKLKQVSMQKSVGPPAQYTSPLNQYMENESDVYGMPSVPAGQIFRLKYVAICPTLVNPSDTFDFINAWQPWVQIDTAIRMRQKQLDDVNDLVRERDYVEKRIRSMRSSRNAGEPPRVTDITSTLGPRYGGAVATANTSLSTNFRYRIVGAASIRFMQSVLGGAFW